MVPLVHPRGASRNMRLPFSAAFFSLMAIGASAEAEQTKAPKLPETPISAQVVAKGLSHPWALQFLPDGRMLVTERPGQLRIVGKDGNISEPVTGVPVVAAQGQGGLLDVALAPDFAESGILYLSYSEPREAGTNGTAVMRAKLVLAGESRIAAGDQGDLPAAAGYQEHVSLRLAHRVLRKMARCS